MMNENFPCVLIQVERESTGSKMWLVLPNELTPNLVYENNGHRVDAWLQKSLPDWWLYKWIAVSDSDQAKQVIEHGYWPE